MNVIQNYSLKKLNTFGMDVQARFFASFSNLDELLELMDITQGHRRFILGGGSNVLFTHDFDGFVLRNEIGGIDIIKEDDDHVYVKAGAGENWHKLVMFCVDRHIGGIENLALIPGNVGASPMQNIGAYGVELKDSFEQLEAFHVNDKKVVTFSNTDCEFGYRESIFKKAYRDQFVITHVTLRLNKVPVYHTSYGAVEQELDRMQQGVNVRTIAQAVINIRRTKLPDPDEIGNAGSFFKNPVVTSEKYQHLASKHPTMPAYPQENGRVKLAAGWLIEQAGWKGYRKGDAGCHAKQALVLVNYGNAKGSEIYDLSEQIKRSVHEKFGVELEREVNIVNGEP